MTYQCYIKSHCEAPDFEAEVEAGSKKEAIRIFLTDLRFAGWTEQSLAPHVEELTDTELLGLSVAMHSEKLCGVGKDYS